MQPMTTTLSRTTNFVKDRFGMFIHWGLYSIPARHEWCWHIDALSKDDYTRYFKQFDPDLCDPRAWVNAAKDAGMKYVVLTVKHHEGFCLWDTKHTDFNVTNTNYGQDTVAQFVEACREAGMRVGLYYSLLDWHHPHFTLDSLHPETLRIAKKYGAYTPGTDHCRFDVNQVTDPAFHAEIASVNQSRDMAIYRQYMLDQIEELLSNYGTIDILWFDFSYKHFFSDGKTVADWDSEELVSLIRSLQPNILLNNRLDLDDEADILTPEQVVPHAPLVDEYANHLVWEGCHTFSGSWGYHRDEHTWKSDAMLIQLLVDHVSKNGNLLLNVGPNSRGEFDNRALSSLDAFGRWMHLHKASIYNCGPAPHRYPAPFGARYTYNQETGKLYAHLYHWPFAALHLPDLAGKVSAIRLLCDGSELMFKETAKATHVGQQQTAPEGTLTVNLPTIAPETEVPVLEITLKEA